ncbi:sarcosine dehydrogenase, mitochondrial [Parasteatoda tepidariorum]|uniref:sarcosine dehydrogenase, mitochondrial n=1 Tax=Parasteatoda tepidariorum TaxID=114398 RepID=UPI00077F883B|nr:sarcosine dehydrogenase, mitochondrial [Parasteatoda tepidariorum]XP_015921051.1 sarcosine dehydrogenase, mitochondrial [Parasteatoda tepidariorum]XP_015921052.1 sarcosine dehydrogenase, mitochondrial [Parasteatoda tepidariorum]XP_042899607.1 sarcosine dehydrogenase, mitochondrial [Parasteatoda tepidariorum]XP_042899608.1 sarcosine dehydrogenase, mitochondrial [Parasteatoda tepidariorum]
MGLIQNIKILKKFSKAFSSVHLYSSNAAPSGVPYKSLKSKDVTTPVSLPNSADVVIIGGGIIGCSTLYHLTKLGCSNAILLEKDQLTAGTTWHTAGLIWRLRPSDTDIQILNYTRHLLNDVLEKETGVHPGWVNNGGLFIANSKERLNEYKRLMTIGKAFGIESHLLTPAETKKLYPLMNTEDLYGTLYSPGDGTVDPAGFCVSLVRGAAKAGAKVFEKCPVTDIHVSEDDYGTKRVTAVSTPTGTVKTNCVVNCTGVWAPYLGKMAGVKVPLIAMKHAYIVTDKIEGIQNMPNTRDHDLAVYLRLQGDALSVGGYESNPIFWENVDKNFAFGLFELDYDVFGTHLEKSMHRVPALERTGIKSTVCGPESFTPDHKPLMGEDPAVRGFYHGCGFNSLGMNSGGGCGRELARWIVHGRPELDMFNYDIRRFTEKLTDNSKWIKERSHESYVKNYSIVYPHDEPLASRNMIKDAFHEELLNTGCVYQEKQGFERPGWFSSDGPAPVLEYDYYGSYGNSEHKNYAYIERLKEDYTFEFPKNHGTIGKECINCRENVSAFNMSYFGKFVLSGSDSQKAVDWIFSNDVNKPPGSTVYTCMLNKHGRVEADLTVSALPPTKNTMPELESKGPSFYLAAGGAASQQNITHIHNVIQDNKFSVTIADLSEKLGLLSIQGPKSRELLQSLTNEDLGDTAFPFSTNKVINLAGFQVLAIRLSFVGELGWELHIPFKDCVPLYKILMANGEKFSLKNAGYRAIDSLSIEKGYRHWHGDLRMDDTPLEAGLGFTCKLKTETPFLGRLAVEKQKKEGLKKKLACFTIDDHVPLWGLEVIWRDDRIVGFLRRADYGFAIGKSIGYGYVTDPDGGNVTVPYLKSGTYHLESMGVKYAAQYHAKSPFDPDNLRVKGIY